MLLIHGKMGTVPTSFYLWGNRAPIVGEKRRWKEAELSVWHESRIYYVHRGPWQWCIIDEVYPKEPSRVRASRL